MKVPRCVLNIKDVRNADPFEVPLWCVQVRSFKVVRQTDLHKNPSPFFVFLELRFGQCFQTSFVRGTAVLAVKHCIESGRNQFIHHTKKLSAVHCGIQYTVCVYIPKIGCHPCTPWCVHTEHMHAVLFSAYCQNSMNSGHQGGCPVHIYEDMKSKNKIEQEGFGLINRHLVQRSACR